MDDKKSILKNDSKTNEDWIWLKQNDKKLLTLAD
jgi:hypothetical protein